MKENYQRTPAFARAGFEATCSDAQDGMTLLDYFAAKAMQGHISKTGMGDVGETFLVSKAYAIAAAMIEERKKYITA